MVGRFDDLLGEQSQELDVQSLGPLAQFPVGRVAQVQGREILADAGAAAETCGDQLVVGPAKRGDDGFDLVPVQIAAA
ncbi:hypothetical protein ACN6K8_003282 [[Kitasatospora] papulosa]|uniref:hypothetical protein n=1 Tax=Streptomyces TaxID=1883 RepID=UPI003426410B